MNRGTFRSFLCLAIFMCFSNVVLSVSQRNSESRGLDQAKLQICRQLEELSSDASSLEYQTMVKQLHKHGLSTCTCIRDYILAEEKQDAQKLIEQEMNAPSVWKNTEELIQLSESRQVQNVKIDQNLSKTIDIGILKEAVDYANIKAAINCVPEESVSGLWAGVDSNIGSPHVSLKIGRLMQQLSKDGQRGVWLHELHHIQDMHAEKLNILKVITRHSIQKLAQCLESVQKLAQCFEKEADRIPAACGSIYDAKCLEATFKEVPEEDDPIFRKIRLALRAPHPNIEERLVWATRIKKLKESESQVIEQKKLKHKSRILYFVADQFSQY